MHWFIKCSRCNHQQYMDFPESLDFEREIFVCQKCHGELRMEDRINGHWMPKYFGRELRGYWINQMMVPWHSAQKIIADSKGDQSVFHNFTLGLPYQPKDSSLGAQQIDNCITHQLNPHVQNAMGVDVGKVKHYVIGNKYGIFRMGTTESWAEIEELHNRYQCYTVCDAMPNPDEPARLAKKYRSKFFISYYDEDKREVEIVRWGEGDKYGVVYSDRTKIFDSLVSDITNKNVSYNTAELQPDTFEEYKKHWGNLYRVITEDQKGARRAQWLHLDGKPDHYGHAHVYQKIAMLKTLSTGDVITTPATATKDPILVHPQIINGQSKALNLDSVVKRQFMAQQVRGDWRTR
jgi:hypothetical protein